MREVQHTALLMLQVAAYLEPERKKEGGLA
ncbi:hypothetical protein SAMN04488689_104188 [Paenibacillus sp. cl6col]|nr:hypothetical protein SAMN04488689_104188 [Paenibacillus sp. cl6col]